MRINIRIRRGISLSEIINSGAIRGAHIGNQYPTNLLLLEHQINHVLYDRNDTEDKNYHPASIIESGNNIKITESEAKILSPYGKTIDNCYEEEYETIAQLHYHELKKIFPKTKIKTFSEYILEKEDLLENVLAIAVKYKPDCFNRFITKSGKILTLYSYDEMYFHYTNGVENRKILKNEVVASAINFTKNLKSSIVDKKNIIFENEGCVWNVLITTLLGIVMKSAEKSSPYISWFLSGPDMVNYVMQCEDDLNLLYNEIGKNFSLSEVVEYNIVPTATAFRFCLVRENGLSEIFALFEEKEKIKKEKDIEIRTSKNKKQIIDDYNKKQVSIQEKIKSKLFPEIFYDLKNGNFLTQYDRKKLSLHSSIKNKSVDELEIMYKYSKELYEKSS